MSGVSAIDEILRYRWSTLTALCTFCHPACDNGFDTPTESFIDTYSNFAFAICFLSFLGSFRLREWIQQLSTIYTRKWDWLWIKRRQPLSAKIDRLWHVFHARLSRTPDIPIPCWIFLWRTSVRLWLFVCCLSWAPKKGAIHRSISEQVGILSQQPGGRSDNPTQP